jgi:hypothetical protein
MRAFEVGREWIVVVEGEALPRPDRSRDEEWDKTSLLAPCHLMI